MRIDSPLPQLDRVFDYAVPESLDEVAVPGVRVRVRFAGRLVNGFIVGRAAATAVTTPLRPIERVVSPDVVLTPAIAHLVERVAARYAGTFSDVVRTAVPPRHARAEQQVAAIIGATPATGQRRGVGAQSGVEAKPEDSVQDPAWQAYAHGSALIDRLGSGRTRGLHAVWSLAPARRWTVDVAAAVRAVGVSGKGVIVVVPDQSDVRRLVEELAGLGAPWQGSGATGLSEDDMAVLTADQGPQRRYAAFLRVLHGHARIVVGTRAAVFAPVHDLAALIVWDDDDESLWDQHAPYWNARDVAAMRAADEGCALLVGGPSRSLVSEQWCATGWARSLTPTRSTVRSVGPRVVGVPDDSPDGPAGRLPRIAWTAAKVALESGPVLVQVARPGYLPRVACATCRTLASCSCGGPLAIPHADAAPRCARCSETAVPWTCPQCRGHQLRAVGIGAQRTAAEIGRAFPDVPVLWSQGGESRSDVGADSCVVVATGGVEPWTPGGYAAVLILDARRQLQRASLRAGEDAARRWFAAACLARPGATVVVDADPGTWAVQALLRWDAAWLARRELAERESARLTPMTRMAALRGSASDVSDLISRVEAPHRITRVSGDQWLLTADRDCAADVVRQLRGAQAARAARRSGGVVHVVVDPREPLAAFASQGAAPGPL